MAFPLLSIAQMPGRQLHELFLLNVVLQLFDGVATRQVLTCWNEGNPLLRASMAVLGPEQALLLFKANACACLVLLRRSSSTRLAIVSLRVAAALYFVLSFVPWSRRLLSLALS